MGGNFSAPRSVLAGWGENDGFWDFGCGVLECVLAGGCVQRCTVLAGWACVRAGGRCTVRAGWRRARSARRGIVGWDGKNWSGNLDRGFLDDKNR